LTQPAPDEQIPNALTEFVSPTAASDVRREFQQAAATALANGKSRP